jgi:hypothetical protein
MRARRRSRSRSFSSMTGFLSVKVQDATIWKIGDFVNR